MQAIVRGRVQGVGFRDATARTARHLGIRGWVRNRADGTVEVLAEGDGAALGQLEAFLRTGPRFAEVTDLELSWPVVATTKAAPPWPARIEEGIRNRIPRTSKFASERSQHTDGATPSLCVSRER